LCVLVEPPRENPSQPAVRCHRRRRASAARERQEHEAQNCDRAQERPKPSSSADSPLARRPTKRSTGAPTVRRRGGVHDRHPLPWTNRATIQAHRQTLPGPHVGPDCLCPLAEAGGVSHRLARAGSSPSTTTAQTNYEPYLRGDLRHYISVVVARRDGRSDRSRRAPCRTPIPCRNPNGSTVHAAFYQHAVLSRTARAFPTSVFSSICLFQKCPWEASPSSGIACGDGNIGAGWRGARQTCRLAWRELKPSLW